MKLLSILFVVISLCGCATESPQSSGITSGYSKPQAIDNVLPQLPSDLCTPGFKAQIVVNFIIGSNGRIRSNFIASPPNSRIDALVKDAVQKWTYRPGMVDGRPVNVGMQLPIDFAVDGEGQVLVTIGSNPGYPSPERMVPDIAAKLTKSVSPTWTGGELIGAKVVVDFLVTTFGTVREACVIESNNLEANPIALAAVRQWQFEPATKNGIPVTSHVQVPIMFQPNTR